MAFDPDKFLATGANKKAFDPDAFLSTSEVKDYGPPELLGEIDAGTRMKRSFASGDSEKRGLLQKEFPGIKFIDDNQVQLPGERGVRYIDDPKFTMADYADLAGDVPVVAGGVMGSLLGNIPGMAAGTALGEAARKAIGRGLLGVDKKQSALRDALDIAEAGVMAPVAEGAGAAVSGGVRAGASAVGRGLRDVSENLRGLLPKSAAGGFAQIEQAVQSAAKSGTMPELPSLAEVTKAERLLPDLQYPVSPIQKTMYRDKQSMDMIGALRRAPVKQGKALSDYEMLQKRELNDKLGQAVQSIAPEHTPAMAAEESGQSLIRSISQAYKQNKKALAPAFEVIQGAPLPPARSRMASLRMRLGSEISEIGDDFVSYGPGGVVISPYNRAMGISPKEYALVKDTVKAAANPNLSIKQIQAVRESLRNEVAPNEASFRMVGRLRKAMLNHITDMVSETVPDNQVQAAFKGWAQNEAKRDAVEQILGGKLESFSNLERPVAEKVLNNVFSDTSNVQVIKEVVDPKTFDSVLVDYLSQLAAKATDRGNFSPQQFARALRNKAPVLREAFKGKEGVLERLGAITDLMRLVPDAPPANPSGTAVSRSWLDLITSPEQSAAGLLRARKERAAGKRLASEIERRSGVQKKKRSTGAKGLLIDRARRQQSEGEDE